MRTNAKALYGFATGLLFLALFLTAPAYGQGLVESATGSAALADYSGNTSRIAMLAVDWTSNATGECEFTLTAIRGPIERVTFDPTINDASPTNLYDVDLFDEDDFNLFTGSVGDNLSNTTVSSTVPVLATYFLYRADGDLTFSITNAGNATTARIRLYWNPSEW